MWGFKSLRAYGDLNDAWRENKGILGGRCSTCRSILSRHAFERMVVALISNKSWVKHTPIVTTLLLEAANVQQIGRMWTEKTAAGQSLGGWVCVNLALILWFNWYRVFTPDQKIAKYSTLVGITINFMVIMSIVYFRYLA